MDEHGRLHRRALSLAYLSMGWMVIEAGVAVTAGILAASIALVGFGLDSVIEFFSAVIVVWQLHGQGWRCGEVLRADEAAAALRHRGHVDIAGFVHAVVALFRAWRLQTLMWCISGGDARPDFPLR